MTIKGFNNSNIKTTRLVNMIVESKVLNVFFIEIKVEEVKEKT